VLRHPVAPPAAGAAAAGGFFEERAKVWRALLFLFE